jgi:hypothetical protein
MKANLMVYSESSLNLIGLGPKDMASLGGMTSFVRLLQRIIIVPDGLKKSANIQGGLIFRELGLEKFHCTSNGIPC